MLQKDTIMFSRTVAQPLDIPHSMLTLRSRIKKNGPTGGLMGINPNHSLDTSCPILYRWLLDTAGRFALGPMDGLAALRMWMWTAGKDP